MAAVIDAIKGVLRVGYDERKTKTALRLCAGRLKLIRNKRENARRALEKEVAELLTQRAGFSYDGARVRCESVCREDATLQAYEILELTLETLLARLPVISSMREVPDELREAIATVIFAAKKSSTEIPELEVLKKQFGRKYGWEYVSACEGDGTARACGANATVMECLKAKTFDGSVVQKRLEVIARENGIALQTPIPTVKAKAVETEPEPTTSYATAMEAAVAAEAAAKRARHASDAAAALAGMGSRSSTSVDCEPTRDLSDADVDAVIGEVLAMPDLTTIDDEIAAPSAPRPPPGVGKSLSASEATANAPKEMKAPKETSAPEVRGEPCQTQGEGADDLARRFAALKKSS